MIFLPGTSFWMIIWTSFVLYLLLAGKFVSLSLLPFMDSLLQTLLVVLPPSMLSWFVVLFLVFCNYQLQKWKDRQIIVQNTNNLHHVEVELKTLISDCRCDIITVTSRYIMIDTSRMIFSVYILNIVFFTRFYTCRVRIPAPLANSQTV
jgi:hypothetical protein